MKSLNRNITFIKKHKFMVLTILIVIILILSVVLMKRTDGWSNYENFTAFYIKPPEWFIKPIYKTKDWLVTYYPDQLSDPVCMDHSRGDPEELNYNSSAYRFWRF